MNEFLDDEHVKAMLSGETKYFEENRKQLKKMVRKMYCLFLWMYSYGINMDEGG